jgi:hypothetical protein
VDTTSTLIQSIDENYPVAGKINDSKGFHDNFSSIKSALNNIDADVQSLKTSSVLSFQDNDFGGYNLTNVNLKNPSVTIAPQGDGTLPIDSTTANYWPITLLTGGVNVINISTVTSVTSATGHIIVSITTSSANTQVVFTATNGTVISIDSDRQPFNLTNPVPYLFEIWNDYSAIEPTVYIKKLSVDQVGELNSQTQYQSLGTNIFYGSVATFNSSTITLGNTDITDDALTTSTIITDGIDSGNIAVVPNRINTVITGTNVSPANGLATEICVGDSSGIYPGAAFYLLGTNTQYTVTGPSVGTILPTTQYDVRHCNIGDPITFVNHQYSAASLITLVDTPSADDYGNLNTGTSYNLQGNIYADKDNLQVTFADPNGATANTFSVSKATTVTNTTTNDLVTVGYVNHYIPHGGVIMWYNSKNLIPYGWWLCDGSIAPDGVATPNLSNRFIIGANDEHLTTSTVALSTQTFTVPTANIEGTNVNAGGTSTSVILGHDHVGTATTVASYDPGHQHLGVGSNQYAGHIPEPNGPFIGPNGGGNGPYGASFWGFTEGDTAVASQWWNSKENVFLDQILPQSEPQTGGIILKTTTVINNTGTVAANNHANLPPYRSLYFIYKWSGQTFTDGF